VSEAEREVSVLEFYYDLVCPYAYLASVQVEALAQRNGVRVAWRPVLLGGLLRSVGSPDDPNTAMSAAKRKILRDDRERSAAELGVPMKEPAGHPLRTVAAMRLCLAAPDGPRRAALSHDLFAAYWGRGEDIREQSVLAKVATRHGLPPDAHEAPGLREGLRRATADAAEVGAFGVPSFVFEGRLWWGQDRLPLVERALGGALRPSFTSLTFFHDFASPFSYLAATQIERIARVAGVELSLAPILLGALFREIGTPDVPLLEMSAAKQAYVRRDLEDWAAWWGVPFRFPRHFPLRSVLPLRVALVESAATAPIYRATWVEDRRVDTPEALGPVLEAAGLPAESLLSRANESATKLALRANTTRARDLELCGVPSMLVEGEGRSEIVWGQDRLERVAAMLAR